MMKQRPFDFLSPSRVVSCFLFGLVPIGAAQDVVMTEFMASNASTLSDEDGDFEDWIEIYNQSDSAMNLNGWHLTDDAADLVKWTFPDVVLNAGELLVVFASNKDRAESGEQLHTNFRLLNSGEYLGLVRPDGVTVEHDFGAVYPQQVPDVSYGLQQSTSLVTLSDSSSVGRYLVPSNADLDVNEGNNPASWIGTGFDDSSWASGPSGFGYATGNNDIFDPHITTDIQSVFYNQPGAQTSIYMRIPFSVANPADIVGLTLKMKYDDGFVAYLNGDPQSLAEANAPTPDLLSYQSSATASHSDSLAVVDESFVIDPSVLNVGENVLCIHGMNWTFNNSDALFVSTLEGTVLGETSTAAYFTSATPGAANVAGSDAPGPLIKSVTSDLQELVTVAGDLAIEAEIVPTLNPVASVNLVWRIMYEAEATVEMLDDGSGPDLAAGDGIYTANIPLSGLAPGQMLRWKVTASDSADVVSRLPIYPDRLDSAEYFGTIARDPSVDSSNLPVFHWFTSSPGGATTVSGSRGSVYYLGRFYDNIQADRHGQSTSGFPKKSYDFDFNKGARFLPWEGGQLAKDINMITNWADKSKTRNTIGYEIMRNSGHPAHYSFPVRIQQNGAFFSTADLVEDGDDNYLDRVGLDEEGALYKMYNSLDSSTSGVNKKTRKSESNSDLQSLISGLGLSGESKLRYGYDNMNLPGTINYLAALDMTNNRDHGHKNYYLYRDTEGTREWRPLIWDIDLCLGRNWVSGLNYFDDNFTNNNLRAGPSNRMKTLIFNDPVLNQMYLRRMRTLMDQMLGAPAAPVNYLQNRVNELVALIDPTDDSPSTGSDDADLDYQKWGSWGNRNAMRPAANRILTTFIPTRRAQLYGLGEIPAAQPVAARIDITSVDFNPALSGASPDQGGEYFALNNPNGFAVDCSDWVISGGVSLTLPPGAVIPAGGTLHVARDAVGFRARSVSPKSNEKRYVVSGYDGQLSARGETINLHDNFGNLIATLSYPGAETAAQKSLRITELLYNPANPSPGELASIPTAGASDFEFIELTNTGTTDLDLSGAQFTSGVVMTFDSGTILTPGQRVIVVSNPTAFELRNGAGHPVAGVFSGNLSNGGEQIQIVDAVGENVLEFTYQDSWYSQTDGGGHSLVLVDPAGTPVTDFDLAANWGVSLAQGGDPGEISSGVAMSFEFWKNQEFTSAQTEDPLVVGPEVDLDGDGRNTLFEYAFAFDPQSPEANPGYNAVTIDHGGLSYQALTFRRRISVLDLIYTVEASDDLKAWDPVSVEVGEPLDNGDGTETVTVRDDFDRINRPRRFLRLMISVNP